MKFKSDGNEGICRYLNLNKNGSFLPEKVDWGFVQWLVKHTKVPGVKRCILYWVHDVSISNANNNNASSPPMGHVLNATFMPPPKNVARDEKELMNEVRYLLEKVCGIYKDQWKIANKDLWFQAKDAGDEATIKNACEKLDAYQADYNIRHTKGSRHSILLVKINEDNFEKLQMKATSLDFLQQL